MCDSVLDHLQIVPTWLVVHIADASAVSDAAFDRTGIDDLEGFRQPQGTVGRELR